MGKAEEQALAARWVEMIKQEFPGMECDIDGFLGTCSICKEDDRMIFTELELDKEGPDIWICMECGKTEN